MRIKFCDIEAGSRIPVNRWLHNIQCYPSVRFFGFVRGRVFFGLIVGAKGKSKLELTQEALITAEDELAAAKRKIAELERV